jgi:hypothetical protein
MRGCRCNPSVARSHVDVVGTHEKDGVPRTVVLRHARQDARGPLFEVSELYPPRARGPDTRRYTPR